MCMQGTLQVASQCQLMLPSCPPCPGPLQLATQPEQHLQLEYTPLHRRLGEEQKRRSAKLAQARVQQVGAGWWWGR